MQNADAKGGVGMPKMRLRFVMSHRVSVTVQVNVAITIMLMLVSVHFESFAQSPPANSDEHNTDDSLAPGRDQLHRQKIPQPKRQQPDHRDAGRMTDPP